MRNVSIQLYKPGDLADFQKYIRQAYHEKYILGDSRYLDWQYGEQLFIARSGDEIVGHFGFRDLLYKVYDKTQPVRILMNLFVLESYRIAGIAALLAKEVFSVQKPLAVFRYRPPAQKLFSHFRPKWRDEGQFKRYMAILDSKAPLFEKYSLPEKRAQEYAGGNFIFTEAVSFGSSFEDLWNRIRGRYPITVERDLSYLLWRFENHPFFRYKTLTAEKDGRLEGYLVWRIEEDDGFRIARIIDLASSEGTEEGLIRNFLDLSHKEGAAAADFLVSSGRLVNEAFSNAGFFDVQGTGTEEFPTLFSPISYSRPFINVGYDFDAAFDDCYFNKADGDQDRPNPH